MMSFVPAGLPSGAPLVVVLHGCKQIAAGFDHGSGRSTLAAPDGFALSFPEQTRTNNLNSCSNWFEAHDTRRGSGETASIANAIAAIVAHHRLDASRGFITGLSAAGAMTSAVLATYPDVFAGSAVIAGLPFGAAHCVPEAMQAMASPLATAPTLLGDRVRSASTFTRPWPVVSVWHGDVDRTVSVRNGEAVAEQWANVHAATRDGDVWRNASGVQVVELVTVDGMGHGTPIDGDDGSTAAPFMLDVGIGSSARVAVFWGIAGGAERGAHSHDAVPQLKANCARGQVSPRQETLGHARPDVGKLINDTLRSVGLMK